MRSYILLLISIATLLSLTLPTIVSGRFTFAFDMGRDMLWVRNMVELRKPTLIGPWGSIAGVYFGPLWFYLLAIPYVLTGGDPRGAVGVSMAVNLVTMIVGWWWLRRHQHSAAAAFWALLYAVSPLVVSISSFAFHANLLPLTTLFLLIGIHNFSLTKPPRGPWLVGLPLAALAVSLSYHLEPASGVMLTVFLGGWIVLERFITAKLSIHRRELIVAVALFLLPFVPQMIFEVRHGLIQTRALVSYFRGENTSLGGVLPLPKRLSERVTKISGTLAQSVFPVESSFGKWFLMGVFLISLALMFHLRKKERFTVHCLLFTVYFLVFHYLAYTFLFPAELKGWYLYGLLTLYLVATALILEWIWILHQPTALVVVATLMLFSGLPGRVKAFFQPATAGADTVAAQLEAVLWIYADAREAEKPFSVYTYTPPIYDYNYQYLLWWKGRTLGVLPAEYSYLPGETSYLPEKRRFDSQQWSPADATDYYLVIEPDAVKERTDGWLGHFANTSLVATKQFPSGVAVQKRLL